MNVEDSLQNQIDDSKQSSEQESMHKDVFSNIPECGVNRSPDNDNFQRSTMTLPRRVLFFIRNRFVIGLVCLGMVVIIWASDGFLINYILSNFQKPFFMTFFSVSTLQLYFVGIMIRQYFAKRKKMREQNDQVIESDDISTYPATSIIDLKRTDTLVSASQTEQNVSALRCLVPMTRKEIFRLSLYFFIVYFTASYFANASFHYTDVPSASILLSTSCFFTLVLCTIFRIDRFTLMKGLSVIICASGVFVLFSSTINDTRVPDRLRGNLYALVSAVLYGVYSVMAKKVIIDESRVDMPLFFGFVGLLSTVLLWPLFLVFHYSGIEEFALPDTPKAFLLLLVKNLVGTLLSNYCWLIALLYTTPLVVAIGLSLCTPLTLLIDLILNNESPISYYGLTGLFIITGFLIVNFSEIYPKFNYFWENLIFKRQADDIDELSELTQQNTKEQNV